MNKYLVKTGMISALVSTSFLLITGCSGGKVEEPVKSQPPKELDPVTIRFHQLGTYFTDQDFQDLIVNPVKKKYPHITVVMDQGYEDLPVLLTKGEAASLDFLVTYNGKLPDYKDIGVFEDITPLANKHKFDLNKFDPGALDAIKVYSDKKELYALPYAVNINALYYNKDIFNTFGVAYPKDGMTWEEAIDVAKKVTRVEAGTQYRGIEVDDVVRLMFPLSLQVVETKTDKVLVNSEPYKRVLETGLQMHSITGNEYKAGTVFDWFLKDRTLAMFGTVNLISRLKDVPDLNWDVAQYPSFKERPNTFGMYDLHLVIPMQMSKNKDDQMRVMEVLFSDEVQTFMVGQTGRVATLKDPKYNQLFGSGIPALKEKSISSIFKSKYAPAPEFSIYYTKAMTEFRKEYVDVITNKKDVNTGLRDSEESIKKAIEAQRGAK